MTKPRIDIARPSGFTRRAVARGLALLPFGLAGCATPSEGEVGDRPWHHTANGFRNPPGSPEGGGDFGDWTGFFWRRLGAPPRVDLPPGHVLAADQVRAGLVAHDGRDRITWLGHASFLIHLEGRTILTDPFLAEHASPLPPLGPKRFAPPGLAVPDLGKVDVLLVSHNHYDHMDLPTIESLPNKAGIEVVVPLGLAPYFTERGFTRVRELDWYEDAEVAGFGITAVPTIHFSKRTLFDRNQTLWTGFAIQGRHRRVHFAGDTAYGPVFQELGRGMAPADIGLVPIGAYEPRALMVGSHTTPEEAVQVGRDLGIKHLVAMHWGTIQLTDEPPFEPPVRFQQAAAAAGYDQDHAWVLKIGETRAI